MPLSLDGGRLIQRQRLSRPPKKLSNLSPALPAWGNSLRPVNSPYIASSKAMFVSPIFTVILSSAPRPGRNSILAAGRIDSAAALAALVVRGPKGLSQTESAGALAGRGLRALSE